MRLTANGGIAHVGPKLNTDCCKMCNMGAEKFHLRAVEQELHGKM